MTEYRFDCELEQTLIHTMPSPTTDSSKSMEQERQLQRKISVVKKTPSRRCFSCPNVSDRTLRTTFLLLICLVGITSFIVTLIVGWSFVRFKHQCPLYASFQFELLHRKESNRTIRILPSSENFGSQAICDFSTFFNVFAFIYCVISGFFFVLFNGDQRIVTSNDQCLIIPWFPISILLGLSSFVNASILTNGFLMFCLTIRSNRQSQLTCANVDLLSFEQYPDVEHFFSYMFTAIICSWFQSLCFIGILCVLIIRLSSINKVRRSSTRKKLITNSKQ